MAASGGYIITANVADTKKIECDEVWLITRAGRNIPGAIRVRSLAPSRGLYKRYYTEWRQRDPEEWWPLYRAEFNRELQSDKKLGKLRELCSLATAGRVIALTCFCKDGSRCHRSLVGQFLKEQGIHVEEFQPRQLSQLNDAYGQMTLF